MEPITEKRLCVVYFNSATRTGDDQEPPSSRRPADHPGDAFRRSHTARISFSKRVAFRSATQFSQDGAQYARIKPADERTSDTTSETAFRAAA